MPRKPRNSSHFTAPSNLPAALTSASPRQSFIELSPKLTVALIEGRQGLLVRGVAVGDRPLTEVSLFDTDGLSGQLVFKAARIKNERVAFDLTIFRTLPHDKAIWEFEIRARLDDGSETEAKYKVAVADDGASVIAGPVNEAVSMNGSAPIMLCPERMALDADGRLEVEGWVVAEAGLADLRMPGVVVRSEIGLPRPDIARAYPLHAMGANAGFELVVELPAGDTERALMLSAVTTSGVEQRVRLCPERRKLAEEPRGFDAREPRRIIRGFCDEAFLTADGALSVKGWALCPIGVLQVDVAVGEQVVGQAELGLQRDDVGDEFATVPMARYAGYRGRFPLPTGLETGALARIVVHNGVGDTKEFSRAIEPTASASAETKIPEPKPGRMLRLEIDSPVLVDGVAAEPVGSRLTIDGWVLSDSGIAGIDVVMDGTSAGEAHYGLVRQDVARAFPSREDAVRCGFAFHCPPRLLRAGRHMAELRVRTGDDEVLTRSIAFEVRETEETGRGPPIRVRVPRAEVNDLKAALDRHGGHYRIGLALRLPSGEQDSGALSRTLESLAQQVYCDWYLIAPAGWEAHGSAPPGLASKVLVAHGDAWPDGLDYIGPVAAGDQLGADMLAELALEAALSRGADFVYADEWRLPPGTDAAGAFYKPDYSPNLLLSSNYIGRPWLASTALLARAGMTPLSLMACGEYDAVLRCTDKARAVRHVAKLLCARGDVGDSPSTELAALREAAERLGYMREVVPGLINGSWRVRRPMAIGRISVIIPTCGARGMIERCVHSLRTTADRHDLEIICIENIAAESRYWKEWLASHADVVISATEAFNWSRFNNLAAARASGEFLLFLNDDVEAEHPGWIDAMVELAAQSSVGVVGARLLYPNRTVQHAGMFLTPGGVGRHAFRFAAEDDPGYFGLALMERDVSAVTGACMMMRRTHFETQGGFDETHDIINNDLDFCLRTSEAGLQVVCTPFATLIHHEQASRAAMPDKYDTRHFQERWRLQFAKGDPFHSPQLTTQHDDIAVNEEPIRMVCAGHPLFDAEEIQRILVVKVDHIGDFVTAMPAIRRLHAGFPKAQIFVLGAPAAQAFAGLEPAITEILSFEFFHARSALGQKKLGEAELSALRARLEPRRFDLAIDLRKHPDTRPLLLATGAKLLAGYDHAGQFPWLDIALEWEGDRGLHPKRSHIVDDLMNLVQTTVTASMRDRPGLSKETIATLQGQSPPPDSLRNFFRKPVVCMHPGAGNEESFVTLADLLVQEAGTNVVVIGGPDEVEIADRIAATAADPLAVRSVAGVVPLRMLPALISRCALYVGNDSGPKHIAALVGVPTIGIHSGTVDPMEWAPFGPEAVAVGRAMQCSPCYLNRLSDCVRNLACIRQIDPGAIFALCRRRLPRISRTEAATAQAA
jgi:O-antigen biosynthesis protein